jgi:hypothetical protein
MKKRQAASASEEARQGIFSVRHSTGYGSTASVVTIRFEDRQALRTGSGALRAREGALGNIIWRMDGLKGTLANDTGRETSRAGNDPKGR